MIKAIKLRTEHLLNPIGIDILKPRFSWNVEEAKKQTAYEIKAEYLNGKAAWESGKVNGNNMFAYYEGKELKSRDRLFWKVRLWDEEGNSGEWSEVSFFEIGLIKKTDWKAKWITANLTIDKKKRYPSDYFRKQFNVDKEVVSARLYITACGLYEASLNGRKIGVDLFAPGYTDYKRRIQYQVYDIKELIEEGRNDFDVVLGDGWYRGCCGALSFRNVFGTETKLLSQIEITYADKSTEKIISDESFSWSNDGQLRYSDLKNGEIVDAAMMPSYSSKARLTQYNIAPTASNNVTVREHEHFCPKLHITPSGKTILDFGQNMSGYIAFSVIGVSGHKITISMGECLDNGEFTQKNFQCNSKEPIAQKIEFNCSGKKDYYKTKFSFFGFRYVLVENWPGEINLNDFTAIATYSAMEGTGDFNCSNKLVNQLVSNTRWSMKSNFVDVPTDCPTREMAGWTGDAQIFCKTASYFMNTAPFFNKWMKDLVDRQEESGKVHCIVPTVGNEGYIKTMDGSVGWADAAVYVPYYCWKTFGDDEFIWRHYPSMSSYAHFMIKRAKKNFATNILKKNPYKKYTYDCYQHFGEWLEPKGVEPGNFIVNIILPKPEEATAYLCLTMKYMAEVAKALGKTEDEKLFSEYMEGAKKAYNYLFVKNNTIDTSRQAKLVRPLYIDILEGQIKKNVEDRLEKALKDNEYKIGTGFLSTPYILPALTKAGKLELAFKVLENEQCPGWLYQTKNDATTIWESWEGYDKDGHPVASHNHYSPGAVCEWLFTTVGGVNVADDNHFIISPHFGGTLTFANTYYDSIYGKVESNWILNNGRFELDITIPCNTTATVLLPNGEQYYVESGKHSYSFQSIENQ